MFTGIIEALGHVVSMQPSVNQAGAIEGLAIEIDLTTLPTEKISIGDSIAVNGTCLTVIRLEDAIARFDVSAETLSKCLIGEWKEGQKVNLERALTLQTPLGGHLVSGHVDGTGCLRQRRDNIDSSWMRFSASRAIGRFIAIKGSITIDGISLTSNNVYDEGETTIFEVTLVPHTLAMTTIGMLKQDTSVHLEIDLVARYLQRMADSDASAKNMTVGT